MTRLTAAQVDEKLVPLPGWKRKGSFISKEFVFDEFMDGIRFVDEVSRIAEGMDHHPDIHIRWTTVRLEIQTHDEGGITVRDLRLARAIEDLGVAKGAPSR